MTAESKHERITRMKNINYTKLEADSKDTVRRKGKRRKLNDAESQGMDTRGGPFRTEVAHSEQD